MSINETQLETLRAHAKDIRIALVTMLSESPSGHTAGPLGMADIFSALYFHILRHDSKNPGWSERDRLILSNGHICPVQYVAMAHSGYFETDELKTLRRFGSRLQGHPERTKLPGVETTSGPLGCGLGQASGIAIGARMDKNFCSVFCILSDGEHDEGNVWESAMFAAKEKLERLIVIVDRNDIQISGKTSDIMPLEPLAKKYESFGWRVIEVDGNDISAFVVAVEHAKVVDGRPTVIIAHTTPGKGVFEIEGNYEWHGRVPTKEEAQRFIASIKND